MNIKQNVFITSHQYFQSSSKKSYKKKNFAFMNIDIYQNWNYLIIECKYKTRFDEDVYECRYICFICHEFNHKTYEYSIKSKSFN